MRRTLRRGRQKDELVPKIQVASDERFIMHFSQGPSVCPDCAVLAQIPAQNSKCPILRLRIQVEFAGENAMRHARKSRRRVVEAVAIHQSNGDWPGGV